MITVDWPNRIVNITRADLTLVQSTPVEVRRLDVNAFRLTLKELEASEEGMPYPDIHAHNSAVSVGSVTLARVVVIINDYTITFEDGQYSVDLIGANTDIGDKINQNQVSVRTSNSAGLIDLPALRQQSFINTHVFIDVDSGSTGTLFPLGTPPKPVDNYSDAYQIADSNGLHGFDIRGTLTFSPTATLEKFNFVSQSSIAAVLVLSGQNTSGATFSKLGVTGEMDGRASFEVCTLGNLTGFSGIARDCGLNGPITMDAANTENMLLFHCTSVIAGSVKVPFDVNGSTGDIHVRDWTGGIKFSNWTAGNEGSVNAGTGSIEFDATCTSGTVKVVTSNKLSVTDNSGPGFTVVLESLPSNDDITAIQAAIATKASAENLDIVNEGVKKASLIIPHTTDLG